LQINLEIVLQNKSNLYSDISIGQSTLALLLGQSVSPTLHTFGNPPQTSYYYSYLYPTGGFILGLLTFWIGRNSYVINPPTGSLLSKAVGAFGSAWRNRSNPEADGSEGFLFRADPEMFPRQFVTDLTTTLRTCKVFLLFPVYWLLYNQMQSNFITQGDWMDKPTWLKSEQLNLVDSIIIIALIPVFDALVFPCMRRVFRTNLGCISRMTIGFVIAGIGFVYAGLLQRSIQNRGNWLTEDGKLVYHLFPGSNKVSVWLQIPPYIFIAISEIFSSVSALEFAYA